MQSTDQIRKTNEYDGVIAHLYPPVLFVRSEAHPVEPIEHSVARDPLVRIIPALGGDPLHSAHGAQVYLQPLALVVVLSDPATSGGTLVPSLQPRTPWAVVEVPHGG